MVSDAWIVGEAEVDHLAARLFDPTRSDCLVIVSPASDTQHPRVNVDELIRMLPAGAEIVVLASMRASTRLSDTVPEAFHCYGGAVRVVRPGATVEDNVYRHRLFTVYSEADSSRLCTLIAEFAEKALLPEPFTARTGSGPALRPEQELELAAFAQQLADRERATLGPAPVLGAKPKPQSRAQSPVSAPTVTPPTVTPPKTPVPEPMVAAPVLEPQIVAQPLPVPVPTPRSPATPASPASPAGPSRPETFRMSPADMNRLAALIDAKTSRLVEDIRRQTIAELREMLRDNDATAAKDRARAEKAEKEVARLKGRKAPAAAAKADTVVPHVYADREQQLRWEIEQEWLTGTPETDRIPLRAFTLGPDFLDSLEADVVPRRKTIQVIIDVLAKRAWERRHCKQFVERGGNQRVREDGGVAWRANVKSESPGAPRFTWWELVDDTVELAHVGHHDDLL